jgi:hypothetical protein
MWMLQKVNLDILMLQMLILPTITFDSRCCRCCFCMLQMLFSNIVDVVFKCCEILFMLLAT